MGIMKYLAGGGKKKGNIKRVGVVSLAQKNDTPSFA